MISAVGIKRILFADIDKVTADITPEIAKTLIQAAIKAKDEVLNVHGETWQIEETEASVTGYKNQLTGKNYRYDDVPGEVSPAFSIGQYDWKTKKAFMGGDVIQAPVGLVVGSQCGFVDFLDGTDGAFCFVEVCQ